MTVFAEGRVKNQKLNQTAALLSFGLVFGFQLDLLEKIDYSNGIYLYQITVYYGWARLYIHVAHEAGMG